MDPFGLLWMGLGGYVSGQMGFQVARKLDRLWYVLSLLIFPEMTLHLAS
jgi:hypothetical protein